MTAGKPEITNSTELILPSGEDISMDALRQWMYASPGSAKVTATVTVIEPDRPYESRKSFTTLRAEWSGNTDPTRKRGDIRD